MNSNDSLVSDFCQSLRDCRTLYRESGQLIVKRYPELAWKKPAALIELMDDLHAGLLIKTCFSIALADRRWSSGERVLTRLLIEHVWQRTLEGDDLRDTAYRLSGKASSLRWFDLVRPFAEVAPLREQVSAVEAIVVRVANIVAKIDGKFCDSETSILQSIQQDLERHLRPLSLETHADSRVSRPTFHVKTFVADSRKATEPCELPQHMPEVTTAEPQENLEQLLEELNSLVGLQRVKEEIETLANLIQLQKKRQQRGLPETDVSLHMVFTGNPGTGKTTVARLVGRILWAMGLLTRGHLVETDRSGLVAEYAGQTGPKSNRCIDEALDGVLFIDEAYSLVATNDDPFGREAVQTLLKRMEDDRERLVVILAGYPQPLSELLATNPGLSSRFSRRLHFDDYQPVELFQIFSRLCQLNHFTMSGPIRARLLYGFDWLYRHRDDHFGNGRAARNVFEVALRRMANRIAGTADITHELLTAFELEDICFEDIPEQVFDEDLARTRFRVWCPRCGKATLATANFLGRSARCSCKQRFTIEWGEPVK